MVRRSRQTSGRKEGEGEGGLRDEGRRVTRRYGVDQELSFGLSEFHHQPEDRTLGSTMGPPVNIQRLQRVLHCSLTSGALPWNFT